MFSAAKTKAKKIILVGSLLLNAGFILEHGAGYAAVHTGLVQGQVKPPALAFGGYDAAKEQQIAMLGEALPMTAMTPPVAKITVPLPARKPQVR